MVLLHVLIRMEPLYRKTGTNLAYTVNKKSLRGGSSSTVYWFFKVLVRDKCAFYKCFYLLLAQKTNFEFYWGEGNRK